MSNNKKEYALLNNSGFAKDLNKFYARFDSVDFSQTLVDLRNNMSSMADPNNCIEISVNDVMQTLDKIDTKKACGPDKLSGRLLKTCRNSLSSIYIHFMFQMSMYCTICSKLPVLWKLADKIPVSKHGNPVVMNDFGPVALTSILAKSLEHIVLNKLLPYMSNQSWICTSLHILQIDLPVMP